MVSYIILVLHKSNRLTWTFLIIIPNYQECVGKKYVRKWILWAWTWDSRIPVMMFDGTDKNWLIIIIHSTESSILESLEQFNHQGFLGEKHQSAAGHFEPDKYLRFYSIEFNSSLLSKLFIFAPKCFLKFKVIL